MTTRLLRKRIKEHVPKSVEHFSYSKKENGIPINVLNASKRSSIIENLVNNSTCKSSYNLTKFKIIEICSSLFDLTCILLRKPVLQKQNIFDYSVSLLS